MKYSKNTYTDALYALDALRDSVTESEKFTIEFIMEAVAEKADRDHPNTNGACVRGMSNDALAGFLAEVENRRTPDGAGAIWNGKSHAFQWLRQAVGEGGECSQS